MENGKTEKEVEAQPAEAEEKAEVEKKEVEAEKVAEEPETEAKAEEEVTPELLEKIRGQIEFYFGDVNMQRDSFLNEQCKLDEGWIPMSIMLKFKALARLSDNVETILKALESSELMEVSEDKKKIRRSLEKPLPVYDEAYKKAQNARTVYCKGFPLQDMTIQILKNYFNDMEPFENVMMRKYSDKEKNWHFKGSIFIQFKTLEDAKAFMARESVKYGDKELIRKFREDYLAEKNKERESRGKKGKQADEEEEDKMEAEEVDEGPGLPKGAVLHFTGAGPGVERESIKAAFAKFPGHLSEQIAYLDYEMGKPEGMVRFQGEDTAKKCLEKFESDHQLQVESHSLTFRLLEGEEEAEYLKKVKEQMVQRRQNMKNKNKRGGRPKRGRGGGARGRKRGGSPNRDFSPKKKAKSS